MLAKTVAELTEDNAELLEEAKNSLKQIETEFALLIADAQALGEVKKNQTPRELARYIQIQISGLRVYAKTYGQEAPLDQMIEDMFTQYPF
jgi:hypothetical protein